MNWWLIMVLNLHRQLSMHCGRVKGPNADLHVVEYRLHKHGWLTGKFWAHAIFYAADILKIQYRVNLKMSPHESLCGTKPDIGKCKPLVWNARAEVRSSFITKRMQVAKGCKIMNQLFFLQDVNAFASDIFFNAEYVHITDSDAAKYEDQTSYADAMSLSDAKLWQNRTCANYMYQRVHKKICS